jgi:hypothetical protein
VPAVLPPYVMDEASGSSDIDDFIICKVEVALAGDAKPRDCGKRCSKLMGRNASVLQRLAHSRIVALVRKHTSAIKSVQQL